ncbi:MAG: CocE/NonD family hydrolase [Dehalococcoidia bacterium]
MPPLMDIRVERNVPVPMRDGTVLRADVFRPAPEGRYPVLVSRTPYDKSGAAVAYGWMQPIRPASEGYVVIVQDVRGRFASDGVFQPFHQEIEDGFDTIEWAATQVWSNGRVGTYGLSYLGATQWLAASATPPNLQCMVPGVTASDYYDGWTYQGGAFELGFNLMWGVSAFAVPELLKAGIAPEERERLIRPLYGIIFDHWPALRSLPLRELPAVAHDLVAPYYKDWLAHATRDAFWERVNIEQAHPRIHVPALNLGGWYDLFIRGTLRNFTGMRANGANERARDGQRLIVGPWAHGTALGARTGNRVFGAGASILLDELHLRWFDHWLKDARNGLDQDPPVRVFLMGANEWRTYDAWPPSEAEEWRWYLHSNGGAATRFGDGVLSAELPAQERPDPFIYDPMNPCPTVGGPLFPSPVDVPPGPFDQSDVERRPDVLCYTSAPLDRDLAVVGPVTVRLWAGSSARDTDFTAKLVDVGPDGVAWNLCDGIMRARYRDGFDRVSALPPGQPVELTIDLAGTANVFLAGHRVRLEVSSSNFPRFDRNTNTGGVIANDTTYTVATNLVFHDEARPSHLSMYVAPWK